MARLSDRDLLEGAWGVYDEGFAEHVGEVVTPREFLDTDDDVQSALSAIEERLGSLEREVESLGGR